MSQTVLTGIKPTGDPHIGNYLGAIRPALQMSADGSKNCFYFVADYHALTTVRDAKEMQQLTREVTATWLALGLDPSKVLLYRQSDLPEVFELTWILSCFTSKGLLNRAHAYKAKVSENEAEGKKDPDAGINVGLYTYPVLMAADILLFDTDEVPVGEDQLQHLEIARDIAQRFNHHYGEILKIPKPVIQKVAIIPGLDGRKMSKSYNNGIPIFADSKKLRKTVMKIQTDSSPPEAPKDPNTSLIFQLYEQFASDAEVKVLREKYQSGIGWGEAKQFLFESIDQTFAKPRDLYEKLMNSPQDLENTLADGATRAQQVATQVMTRVRKATGILK